MTCFACLDYSPQVHSQCCTERICEEEWFSNDINCGPPFIPHFCGQWQRSALFMWCSKVHIPWWISPYCCGLIGHQTSITSGRSCTCEPSGVGSALRQLHVPQPQVVCVNCCSHPCITMNNENVDMWHSFHKLEWSCAHVLRAPSRVQITTCSGFLHHMGVWCRLQQNAKNCWYEDWEIH